jgi:hypothetical protein
MGRNNGKKISRSRMPVLSYDWLGEESRIGYMVLQEMREEVGGIRVHPILIF